jgi:hypothetical protein
MHWLLLPSSQRDYKVQSRESIAREQKICVRALFGMRNLFYVRVEASSLVVLVVLRVSFRRRRRVRTKSVCLAYLWLVKMAGLQLGPRWLGEEGDQDEASALRQVRL